MYTIHTHTMQIRWLMCLMRGKQGDILRLPGVMLLDRRANPAADVGDFPCLKRHQYCSVVSRLDEDFTIAR